MTQKQILEGNRIIAVFDGWYQKDLPKNGDINWFHPTRSTKITDNVIIPSSAEYFQYHSSWDWLMPVYIKIAGFFKDDDVELPQDLVILFNILYERLGDGDGIEEVYKYVCEFIKAFNKINQNDTKREAQI